MPIYLVGTKSEVNKRLKEILDTGLPEWKEVLPDTSGDKKLARELFDELNRAAIGIPGDTELTKAWLRSLLMALPMAPPAMRKTRRVGPSEVKVPIWARLQACNQLWWQWHFVVIAARTIHLVDNNHLASFVCISSIINHLASFVCSSSIISKYYQIEISFL